MKSAKKTSGDIVLDGVRIDKLIVVTVIALLLLSAYLYFDALGLYRDAWTLCAHQTTGVVGVCTTPAGSNLSGFLP